MPGDLIVLRVAGMTCQHCVAAVHDELQRVPMVTGVAVELGEEGTISIVTLQVDGAVDVAAVEDAVARAGYTVAGTGD